MLVSPTCTRSPTRAAATPTVAQSWVLRVNLRYVPCETTGMRISVSTSCCPSAVVNIPVKKSRAGIVRSPAGPCTTSSASSGQQDRPEIRGRVAVRDRAADRAAMADLRVADVRRRGRHRRTAFREDRVDREPCERRQRSDRDVVAVVADVAQVVEAADVDEQRGTREAQSA